MSALSDYMNGFTTDDQFLDALYDEEVKVRHEELKHFGMLERAEPPKEDADTATHFRTAWCWDCPNKDYCPIRYTSLSWGCLGKEILKEDE